MKTLILALILVGCGTAEEFDVGDRALNWEMHDATRTFFDWPLYVIKCSNNELKTIIEDEELYTGGKRFSGIEDAAEYACRDTL